MLTQDVLYRAEFCTEDMTNIALSVGRTAIDFAAIERVPRYSLEKRENDAEHSFMLSMLAIELATQCNAMQQQSTFIDPGLVAQYATVHDLIELETGDTPTFNLTPAEHSKKCADEAAAKSNLFQRLPPYLAELARRYEEQSDVESRLVKLIDKLLPIIVDIVSGTGVYVMQRDYHTHSAEQAADIHANSQRRLENVFAEPWAQPFLEIRQMLVTMFIEMLERRLDGEQLTIDYV
jgi:putative hydrolase of HD superfamily